MVADKIWAFIIIYAHSDNKSKFKKYDRDTATGIFWKLNVSIFETLSNFLRKNKFRKFGSVDRSNNLGSENRISPPRTHLRTKCAIVRRQIAGFVCRLSRNKSNVIWNFLSTVHACNLSTNNRRTLPTNTSSRFCPQGRTKPFLLDIYWKRRRIWNLIHVHRSTSSLTCLDMINGKKNIFTKEI